MLASIRPVGVECGTHHFRGLWGCSRHVGVSAWRGGGAAGRPWRLSWVWCWASSSELWSRLWGAAAAGPMAPVGAAAVLATTLGPRLISG